MQTYFSGLMQYKSFHERYGMEIRCNDWYITTTNKEFCSRQTMLLLVTPYTTYVDTRVYYVYAIINKKDLRQTCSSLYRLIQYRFLNRRHATQVACLQKRQRSKTHFTHSKVLLEAELIFLK